MLKLSTIILCYCCVLIIGVRQPFHQEDDKAYTNYLVRGVNKQLGIFNNRMLRRSGKQSYAKRSKSLIITTILSNSEEDEKLIGVCLPKSLKKFHRRHYNISFPKNKNLCIQLMDNQRVLQNMYWKNLDQRIEEATYLKQFKKGVHAPTLSPIFSEAKCLFALEFLFQYQNFPELMSNIAFFKHHPGINEQILNYAVVSVLLNRKDTSNELSTLEVSKLSLIN